MSGEGTPIDIFTGQNADVVWEDWLPIFELAANWNGWDKEEILLQLAGHFRHKALQEWSLLSNVVQSSYILATQEMQSRLDYGTIAAQEHPARPGTAIVHKSTVFLLMEVWLTSIIIQVFAIEFVTFAIEFVPFAVEFVAFAIEFVALAIELGAFALVTCKQAN